MCHACVDSLLIHGWTGIDFSWFKSRKYKEIRDLELQKLLSLVISSLRESDTSVLVIEQPCATVH